MLAALRSSGSTSRDQPNGAADIGLTMDNNQDPQGDAQSDEQESFLAVECSGSGSRMASSSEKTVSTSSTLIPCFERLARAFAGFQVTGRPSTQRTYNVHACPVAYVRRANPRRAYIEYGCAGPPSI